MIRHYLVSIDVKGSGLAPSVIDRALAETAHPANFPLSCRDYISSVAIRDTSSAGVHVTPNLEIEGAPRKPTEPTPMLLWCPECSERHIDRGDFAQRPHHTHACQECGHVWRPAIDPTVGVQFLPGFKNT